MKEYENYPVAFLYKPGCWPPVALIEGEEPFRRRKDYPTSGYFFSDFLNVRRLWVNVYTRKHEWTTGEIVNWNGRMEDVYFDNDYRSPLGPFMCLGGRLVCECWVFISNPDEFLAKQERLNMELAQQAFMSGDNSVLKQGALF